MMSARLNVYGSWVNARVSLFLKGAISVDSREPWRTVPSELRCHVYLSEASRRLLEVPSFDNKMRFPFSCDGYYVANAHLDKPVETLVVTSMITRLVVVLKGDPAEPIDKRFTYIHKSHL
jgi:hypothetical protein